MITRRAVSVYVDPENEHETREIVERAMHVNATFPYEVTAEPAPQTGECAWMIERRSVALSWFTGEGFDAGSDGFGSDPHSGIRFARREDAEKVIEVLGLLYAIATEHKWYKASTDAHAVE